MSLFTLHLLHRSLLSHQKTWSHTHFQLNLGLLHCNQSNRDNSFTKIKKATQTCKVIIPRYRQNGSIFHPSVLQVYSIKLKTSTLNGTCQPDQLFFTSKAFPKPFSQRLGILKADKKVTRTSLQLSCFVKGGARRLVSTSFVRCDVREWPGVVCHLLSWVSKTTDRVAER